MKFFFKNKKVFLIVSIFLIIVFVVSIVVFISNKGTQNFNQEVKMEKVNLGNFTIINDFTLSNNIKLSSNHNELFYIKDFEEMVIHLRNLAQKFGLEKELFNEVSKNYRWVKNNFRDQNYIYLDSTKGFFEFSYSDGIAEVDPKNKESLDKLINVISFNNLNIQLKKIDSMENAHILRYKLIYKDKTVYFDQGTSDFLTLYVLNNKVIFMFGYLFSTYLSGPVKLKPLEYVGPENISLLDYRFYIYLDQPSSSSSMGGEYIPYFPLNLGFRQFKEEAFMVYRNKDTGQWLLLPVLVIESNFLDARDQRGTFDFILVNQSP